jgi:arginase
MAEKIRIIGVPMDLGASRRGVDMGPSALRVAGLQARLKQLGRQVEDIGNVPVRQPEEQPYGEKKAKYLDEIAEACKGLAEMVRKTLEEDLMPLVLGGALQQGIQTHWHHLARCTRRHEHAGIVALRKRPWHAPCFYHGFRSSGPHRACRDQAHGRAAKCGSGRNS